VLPAIAALGGMVVPALVYSALNSADEFAMQGWAIPTATDIAFALGVLSLLGSRVPTSLKIFLVSLAIFDDMGAIIIIAIFYTADISTASLVIAALCIAVLFALNRRGVGEMTPYIIIGIIMWVAVLKSGVHATLAGVVLAFFIPMRDRNDPERSLLKELEHDLHGAVAFFILPLFAFANSGISLSGVGVEQLFHPVPLGIAAGLFIGKQLGVFLFCWLGIKLGLARLPQGISWSVLYGASLITGIGFTMSLFIGSLSFEQSGVNRLFDERLGIIIGSLLSAISGYLLLRRVLPGKGEQST
jgi:NhaA family Na+:H+ antiporter